LHHHALGPETLTLVVAMKEKAGLKANAASAKNLEIEIYNVVLAPELAVRHYVQANGLLERNDLTDRLIFDRSQLIFSNRASPIFFARFDQILRAQQAADEIGMKWWIRR
jgi:hypothetical protein